MKLFGLILPVLIPFLALGQIQSKNDSAKSEIQPSKFILSLSTFNHAEWLMEGQTTYILTEAEIKVINTSFGEKKGDVIFSKKVAASSGFIDTILKLRLDSLKDFYTNWCVMTTSGNEYFLNFASVKQKKKVSLHHYYLKQIDDIIQIFNSLVPMKNKLLYSGKDEKQDCRL